MILRKFILPFTAFLISQAASYGQPPQRIPYQAIARDASGNTVVNQNIGLRFSIHNLSSTGPIIWQEEQAVLSNALGVIITKLGLTNDLDSIDWVHDNKYLEVEMDISGGTNYLDMGTEQMESVPYALMAGKAGNGVSSVSSTGDTLYLENGSFIIIPGISSANHPNPGIVSNHSCGAQNIHNPDLTYGTMTDQEGNVYKSIIIGTQEWMAENLKTRYYGNGEVIPSAANCCSHYYDFDESYSCPHGMTYSWYVCTDSRQLCPVGWHVPSDAEWTILTDFLGGNEIAGGRMKSIGNLTDSSGFWLSPNGGASNSSGFSALPSGAFSHNMNGGFMEFLSMNNNGYYWSSTSINAESSYYRVLTYNSESIIRNYYSKLSEYSVRCVRD
jgi:uncharacterized protein (TIGR02145 family)